MTTHTTLADVPSLDRYGIHDVTEIVRNPSYEQLFSEETNPALTGYERGMVTALGAVKVDTGVFTGRSPKDKYLVLDDTTRDTVWWSEGEKMTINRLRRKCGVT